MVTQPERDQVTHPLYVLGQAAKVGGVAAVPGMIVGAYAGTLKTTTPVLFSLVSGAQWFAIGSTFWTIRSSILNNIALRNWWNITRGAPLLPPASSPPSKSERVRASAISGSVTGAVLGLVFRGSRNVVPGTIMFTLFGYGGQHVYEYLDGRNTEIVRKEVDMKEQGKEHENWMQRMAKKKWSPMSVLTDEEYERMLSEKVLSVEAEIALIDEKIEEFRKMQREAKKVQGVEVVDGGENK